MARHDDKTKRQRYTLYLDADLRTAIAVIKARDGISESEQIRRAVREWIERRSVTTRRTRKRK